MQWRLIFGDKLVDKVVERGKVEGLRGQRRFSERRWSNEGKESYPKRGHYGPE